MIVTKRASMWWNIPVPSNTRFDALPDWLEAALVDRGVADMVAKDVEKKVRKPKE